MINASRVLLAALTLTLAAPFPSLAEDDRWVHLGPFGGPVLEVEIAPSAHRTLYVSGGAGVYRSDDAAAHWHAAWEGLPPSVRALAVDPTAAGTVYAGVLSPVTPEAASLYKSVDRGVTWAPLGVSGEGIFGIAIDPHDPERILAAGQTGLFRSEDGGETWSRSEVNAGAPPSAYLDSVAFNSFAGVDGMLKSSDGGATWKQANEGLGGRPFLAGAIAPSNPAVIYESVVGYSVVRSSNGGADWRVVSPTLEAVVDQLAVDPRDANRVYAAGGYGRFWRSRNGGSSWTATNIEDGGCAHPSTLTVDPRRPDRLLLAGFLETGCARGHETSCLNLETTDAGATWTCLEGARDAYLPVLVPDPRRPETLYGTGTEGISKSTDGGETWTLLENSPANASSLVISPQGTLWAGTGSVFRSRDGGLTWRAARGLPADRFVSDLVRAPSNASILYTVVGLYVDESQAYDYDLAVLAPIDICRPCRAPTTSSWSTRAIRAASTPARPSASIVSTGRSIEMNPPLLLPDPRKA